LRLDALFSPSAFQSQKTPDPVPSTGGWRLNLRLLRWRGSLNAAAQEVDVEIDETTGDIHEAHPGDLAAELARAAARRQQA
jgi:hypothetical protein